MEKLRKFTSNIAKLRKRAGLTQRSLAIALDVTEVTIRNWEKGALDWLENVVELCDIFECSPRDLLENFKKMREEYPLTQAELAQAMEVTENTIALWEKGNFDGAKKADKLCEVLNCSLEDLYEIVPGSSSKRKKARIESNEDSDLLMFLVLKKFLNG